MNKTKTAKAGKAIKRLMAQAEKYLKARNLDWSHWDTDMGSMMDELEEAGIQFDWEESSSNPLEPCEYDDYCYDKISDYMDSRVKAMETTSESVKGE